MRVLEVWEKGVSLGEGGRGETKAYSEEKVANVVGNVHGQANVGKVEAVAQRYERQADNVVAHELLEVLARLLHAQQQHDGLLRPVSGLEEVVELEDALERLVREALVEAARVKVPHGRPAHDVHARRPQHAKVDGRVHLLHVAGLLAARLEPGAPRHGPQDLLHDELARKGQDDRVKGDKGNVPQPLSVVRRLVDRGRRQLVREEDEVVDRVALARVERVQRQEDDQDEGRQRPRVLEGKVFGAAERRARLSPLGEALCGLAWCRARVLEDGMVSGLLATLLLLPLILLRGMSPYLCAAMQMGQARSQGRRARVADAQVRPQTARFPPPPRGRAHLARQLTICRGRRAQQRERLRVSPGRHGGLAWWRWCRASVAARVCGEVSPRDKKKRKAEAAGKPSSAGCDVGLVGQPPLTSLGASDCAKRG